MKKGKILFMLFISLFMNIAYVKADGAGPGFVRYDGIVIAEQGAKAYQWENGENTYKKTISKGEKVIVEYEYEDDDILWSEISIPNDEEDYYYVKASDIHPIEDSYDMSYAELSNIRYYVYDNSNVVIKSGPGFNFDNVDVKLNNGDILVSTYNYGNTWALVKIGSKSGWLYTYDFDSGVLSIVNDEILTVKETAIYDKDLKEIGVISKGEFIDIKYVSKRFDSPIYYVEYNGISGFIIEEEVANKQSDEIMLIDNIQFYEDIDFTTKTDSPFREGQIIPGQKNISYYCYGYDFDIDNYAYIFVIDGKMFFAKLDGFASSVSNSEYLTVNNKNGASLYSDIKMKNKIADLEYKETLLPRFYYSVYDKKKGEYVDFYYVTYNGQKGWVNTDQLETQGMEIPADPIDKGTEYNYDYEIEPTYQDEEEVILEQTTNPTVMIVLCFLGGIVVALTGVVIFVIINKKRKEKQSTPQTENYNSIPKE